MSPVEPEYPVDLDAMIFLDEQGQRRIAQPNRREEQLAEALQRDRGLWGPMGATHTLAAILAAVRNGSTLAGPRSIVGGTCDVSVHAWRDNPADAERMAGMRARRQWATELDNRGLRPLGWPPVMVTFLRFRDPLDSLAFDPGSPGVVEVPRGLVDDGAPFDLVRVWVESGAVPLR